MDNKTTEQSLWGLLEGITENLKYKRLADVFRFVSFQPFETFGPHQHLRIEINYVKKGNCILHLENESISFNENEMMIICSNVEHTFEAGSEGTTLMQLEFLPEIFSRFNPHAQDETGELTPVTIFSEENRLIKIVNNVRIMRAVQRIVNEMNLKNKYYQYLVVMYYAELLILIYRYMDESYLPICTNESLKKAISYIRMNYQTDISISDVAGQTGVGERYLRKLFAQHLNLSPRLNCCAIRRCRSRKSVLSAGSNHRNTFQGSLNSRWGSLRGKLLSSFRFVHIFFVKGPSCIR